jgi:hypothetical protein
MHGWWIGRVGRVLLLWIWIYSRGAFWTGVVRRKAGGTWHWGHIPVGLLIGRRLRGWSRHLHEVVWCWGVGRARGQLLFSTSRMIAVGAWLYATLDCMAITATRVGAPWIVGQRDGGGRDREIPRAALNRDSGAGGVGPVVGRTGRASERRSVWWWQ